MAWLIGAALLLPSRTAAAVDPAVARTLARIRAAGDTQTDFSAPPPPDPPDPASAQWLVDLFRWLAGDGNVWVKGVALSLVAALVLAILYFTIPVVRETVDRWLRRKPKAAAPDAPGWQPNAANARNLLAEADALAAEGRFAEAAHLLLERSVEDIAQRKPGLIKPALTARAIGNAQDLPGAAREALARIVAAVERSRWARRTIDASDWADSRSAYEVFAFGPHWRGVAA